MNIYYQWYPWAYGNKASIQIAHQLWISVEQIIGVETFTNVFEKIQEWHIGVLPIENSYAGSIHENFYHLISGDYKIVWEIFLNIDHCLLWKQTDISKIKKAYSHPQALMQCHEFLQQHSIEAIAVSDTAGAAQMISEQNNESLASISSDLCSDIYGLEIIQSHIQDQTGNTTRFFVVIQENMYRENTSYFSFSSTGKISLQFKTKDIPSALYKCLGAFATRHINLTKIESLPARENKFEYIFWVDINTTYTSNVLEEAFEELQFFCKDFKILWIY